MSTFSTKRCCVHSVTSPMGGAVVYCEHEHNGQKELNVLFEIMECNFFVVHFEQDQQHERRGVWNENLFLIRLDLRYTIGSITHTDTHTHIHTPNAQTGTHTQAHTRRLTHKHAHTIYIYIHHTYTRTKTCLHKNTYNIPPQHERHTHLHVHVYIHRIHTRIGYTFKYKYSYTNKYRPSAP